MSVEVIDLISQPQMRRSIGELKSSAKGRWCRVLTSAGLSPAKLYGLDQSCPKCGGLNTFEVAEDVEQTGRISCSQCFTSSTTLRAREGLASIAWLESIDQFDAALRLEQYLEPDADADIPLDILERVCHAHRLAVANLVRYGARPDRRRKVEVARVDVYDETGRVFSHYDLTPTGDGQFKSGRETSGLMLPGRLPQAGETWVFAETLIDAVTLTALGFNAVAMPSPSLLAKYSGLFKEVNAVCLPSFRGAGSAALQRTCENLAPVAASVRVARVADWLPMGNLSGPRALIGLPMDQRELSLAILNAGPWTPNETPDSVTRPQVLLSLNEGLVANSVVSHLGRLGWDTPWIEEGKREASKIYVRGGVLVQTIHNESPEGLGQWSIRQVPYSILRERISDACELFSEKTVGGISKFTPERPTKWLIDAIHQRGTYDGKIRHLSGIIQAPTLRSDGSVIQSPGYDSRTGVLYIPNAEYEAISERPSQADAEMALQQLLDVIADFPMFEESDRSAWVCLVLSLIGRSCIPGYVPMFAITANVRGSGKSLLVDAASLIAFGRPAARKAFTRDEDEMRKVITSIALDGSPSILFDNIDTQLGGASLDLALTSPTHTDRLLGTNRMTGDLPMRTVFCATGNNLTFGSDTGRRVLCIRLESPMEAPENRTGFGHPNLLSWIKSVRPKLAIASLTILRAYFVAGMPRQRGCEWGSFEEWTGIVRNAVVWSGGADPLSTRVTEDENDESAHLLRLLITGLLEADPERNGLTTKQIEAMVSGKTDAALKYPAIAEAVSMICPERFHAQRFGKRLRSYVGRVWQGQTLRAETGHGNVVRWTVVASRGWDGGSGGSKLSQSLYDEELMNQVDNPAHQTLSQYLIESESTQPLHPTQPSRGNNSSDSSQPLMIRRRIGSPDSSLEANSRSVLPQDEMPDIRAPLNC